MATSLCFFFLSLFLWNWAKACVDWVRLKQSSYIVLYMMRENLPRKKKSSMQAKWCENKKSCSFFHHHPWVIIGYLFFFSSIPSFVSSTKASAFNRWLSLIASRYKTKKKRSVYNKWFSHFPCECGCVCKCVSPAGFLRANFSFVPVVFLFRHFSAILIFCYCCCWML